VDGKHFQNGSFRKRWLHDIHAGDFPDQVFLNQKFIRRSADEGASINISLAFSF